MEDARLGEHKLAASGHDDSALVLAARARLALGDVERALRMVRHHAVARAAAPTSAMESVLREAASRSPAHASTALRLLARELLRVGDYDRARMTLDELPAPASPDEAERVALLRAESHIRAGEPEAAQRALVALERAAAKGEAGRAGGKGIAKARTGAKAKGDAAGSAASAGVMLTLAQLAILRGELAPARATLEAIASRTTDVPQLEARRAVVIAASHLYEERYELTHAWTSRARAAQKEGGVPVERVVTILDVHSLLGLGEVDRAEEVLARETRDRPDGGALELAALVRRGEHTRALDVADDAAIEALDQRADRLFRSVLARDLVRACIGTGQLARADRMLRLAESAFRRHRPRGDGGADAVIRREDVEGGHEGQGRGARGAGGGVARPRAPRGAGLRGAAWRRACLATGSARGGAGRRRPRRAVPRHRPSASRDGTCTAGPCRGAHAPASRRPKRARARRPP